MKEIKTLITFLSFIMFCSCFSEQKGVVYTQYRHTKDINKTTFSEDSSILVSASSDKTLGLWDVKSKKFIKSLIGHTEPIKNIFIHKNQNILVSAGDDKRLILWNLKNQEVDVELFSNLGVNFGSSPLC